MAKARSAMETSRLEGELGSELPSRLLVGRGNVMFLEGICSCPGDRISDLKVLVDDEAHPVIAHGMPRPGSLKVADRWWAMVKFERLGGPRTATIGLRAELRHGGQATTTLATIQLEPGFESIHPGTGATPQTEPLIAICMATYRPPRELLQRQIDSIKAQTDSNWVCLISDDGSGSRAVAEIEAAIDDDPRFRLSGHDEQLGFYGNFERALRLVPRNASYVAFADQDDRWYPDKLEVLRSALEEEGANLAYSDMRIVTETGNLISDTFWRYRKNNFKDLASVLIANTITGAASLFRRDLLEYALPLPPRFGSSFHDQWIAAVALALGTIAYVDRPLHDYVQHGEAAQGFLTANKVGVERAERLVLPRRALRKARALISPREPRPRLLASRAHPEPAYFNLHMHTQLLARVLKLRCVALMPPARLRTVNLLIGAETSPVGLAWLAGRCLRPLVGATETFARERRLLAAILWRRTARMRQRLRRAAGGRAA